MPVERLLPSDDAHDLIALTRDIAISELAPRVVKDEADERFPAEVFSILGAAGLLGLPYPEELGTRGARCSGESRQWLNPQA